MKAGLKPLPTAVVAVGFLCAAVFASFANGYYVFVIATMALTAIVGIGLNVLVGLTGQVSFGHVGFYAIGAYTVAILTTTAKLPFALALMVAALLSGAIGALLAMPALRVRGPYLAMITIAFGFIVENVAVEWRGLTGGQNGIMGIPSPSIFGTSFGERGVALLAIGVAALLLCAFWRLSVSNWGQAMRAVKDSELAAESIGLNPVTVKTVAFTVSAICAGIAGGLFAPLSGFVTPSTFAFSQSLLFVLVVIIGGAGTVTGPLVGSVVVVLLPEALSAMAEYRLLFFGALLLLVLLIAPEGIVGEASRLLRRKSAAATTNTVAANATPFAPAAPLPLAVEGLAIAFGGIKAVNGIAFTAAPGKVTSLIGPNGAGKTTVLNMLGGFYRPDAGNIRLGKSSVEGQPTHAIARAGVARTYQTSQLFGSMSVFDNLAIARCKGRLGDKRHDTTEAVSSLAAFVGYQGDLMRRAADLPHVDRRLIEIARALATGPGVLLLDEPAAGLSGEDKRGLAHLLRRIADGGITLILVEHDMSLVMSISDHVVVIDAGVCIAAGPAREVQQNPAVKRAYLGENAGRPSAHRAVGDGAGGDLLEVGRLHAGYGAEPVLKGIDLRVRQNEMVAVLGANGSGKSTLMRALSGLHRPVDGGISMAGESLQHMPAHVVVARGVALVPEGRQVFPELSVLDNIRLGAFLRRDFTEHEVEAMLDRFPRLRERLHQRAGLLSGGEQQMLAVARGLMSRPRLLLLDEPSLGLAPAIINDLFAVLDRLRSERVTILLVDQMAELALALADRAYVIESGAIVASGSAAEIAADGALQRAYLGIAGFNLTFARTQAARPHYNEEIMSQLRTHGRYPYRAIHARPDYSWPGRKRLAVYIGFNVEHFAFGEGLGATLAPAGPQPDVLNFSWRDYGNRVGLWRCLELFDSFKLPVGALVNTSIYDYCPEAITAMRERGYEIIGHGHTNSVRQGTLTRAAEKKLIENCTRRIRKEEGRSPRGWLSPWISESVHTPDLLQRAGYTYSLNWCHDDQPLHMRAGSGYMWTIPYPQEINDIPAVMARQAGAEEFADLIVANFDEMLQQSKAQPLVMGIALHPYIVGQPFRLRYLRKALKHIVTSQRAWLTTPGAIVDHMNGLLKVNKGLREFIARAQTSVT